MIQLRRNIVFLFLTLALTVGIGWVLLNYDKVDIHLWMNQWHTPGADFFFQYYTYVGEWVPYVVVAGLLFYKAGWATFLLTDLALSGIIAQRLKYVFDTDRPYKYFQDHCPDLHLQLVDGVELSKFYSFPSGHTTTFFALFFVVCLILTESCENKQSKHPSTWISHILIPAICFMGAVLGAYSRIYLSQHFLEDIWGGILIGILSTLLLLPAARRLENTPFWTWNLLKIQKKNHRTVKK